MGTFILVSLGSGLILAVLDVVLNANPWARRLYSPYAPIARKSVPMVRGVLIDFAFGFILAGFYLIIHRALPGPPGVFRALGFGFIVWVLRTLMNALSQWTMFDIPALTHLYTIGAGLLQSMAVAFFYGATLSPVG